MTFLSRKKSIKQIFCGCNTKQEVDIELKADDARRFY